MMPASMALNKVLLRLSVFLVMMSASFFPYCVSASSSRPLFMSTLKSSLKMQEKRSSSSSGKHWALLIAGSAGWGNYRHQADIAHSYQVVSKWGIPDENIVVMMADDIANSYSNPHKGTIINKPGGPDVYKGVPKDYTGKNVNAKSFLSVLAGDSEGATKNAPDSTGKVIASGPDDVVFVYFADHGGPGILGMPNMPFLQANDLIDTLKAKAAANGFKKLVFYVEACESGSIFQNLMPTDLNIYVMTAANAQESSWGCYCPGMQPAPPAGYNTCLGDLFSVSWLEDSDASNLGTETLEEQYTKVKRRTSHGGTYKQGSHVTQFGSNTFVDEPVDEFVGDGRSGAGYNGVLGGASNEPMDAIPQRDADLHHLWMAYMHADDGDTKESARAAFEAESKHRASVDDAVVQVAIAAVRAGAGVSAEKAAEEANRLVSLIGDEKEPLTKDWDCFGAALHAFHDTCVSSSKPEHSQYWMKHSRVFANLCNAGFGAPALKVAAERACAMPEVEVA